MTSRELRTTNLEANIVQQPDTLGVAARRY